MKANKEMNVNVATIAETLALQVWEASVVSPLAIAATIATLCNEAGEDYKEAGAAFGAAWRDIGANIEGGVPCRCIIAACAQTNMDRKAVLKFVNGADIVSKQRVSQLVAVIVDGDKSKNKGNKTAAELKSQDVLTDKEKAGLQAELNSEPKTPATVTVGQILTLIAALPAITEAEASQLAVALKAKLAASH
jgi:hypothetical protein